MKTIIFAPISVGELVDKITILEIKTENIQGEALANIQNELQSLKKILNDNQLDVDSKIIEELRQVNRILWKVEDKIRHHEGQKDFGENFIDLARSVYRHNDQRAAIKRRINIQNNSELIEEKSYQDY